MASNAAIPTKRMARRRLAVRLMMAIVLFSFVVTLVVTSLQVYNAYDADVSRLSDRFDEIERTSLPSIIENTWLLDSDRLGIVLEGMMNISDVSAATVTSNTGDVLATIGSHRETGVLNKTFILSHKRRNNLINIGTLSVSLSLGDAVQRAKKRAGILLLSTTLSVSLVAFLLYFLVHRMITRHLEELARYARTTSLDKLETPLVLLRDKDKDHADELSDLVVAINEMREGLRASNADLRALNENLEHRVAERTAELTREILTRTAAEENLRETLAFNEELISTSSVGISVFDENGQCIAANPEMARVAGAEISDLLQQNYRQVPSWKQTPLLAMAEKALATRETQKAEINITTTFGKQRDISYHLVPVQAGVRGRLMLLAVDVADAKRAERALRQSEQKFRDYAEAASEWLWETDANHKFTEIQGAGPEMIGIELDNILGKTRWDIATPDDLARDPEAWDSNRDDMENHRLFRSFEYSLTGQDGRVSHVSINGKPVYDEDGNFAGYRGTGQDVTARREIEIQLIQASKMATVGEMATGIAHELNQPLNVIRLAVSNIMRRIKSGTAEPDYTTDKLNKIDRNVERATAIIDHMRIFGRKETAIEELDAGFVIDSALGMIGQQLRLADIAIDINRPDYGTHLRGNLVQIEQVILNILSNARDALLESDVSDKRITIEIAECSTGPHCKTPACVRINCDGNAVAILIRDNAGGIPEGVMNRIFEPFFTTKEAGKGTGLGLSISYGIIKDMGGNLQARNTENGAEFTILLPQKMNTTGVGGLERQS